jgi:hypothetical protein
MSKDLTARKAFGDVIRGSLTAMADDYERIAQELRAASNRVDGIGEVKDVAGRARVAADIAMDAVGAIRRNTPSLSGFLRATSDYDRHVRDLDS